MKTIFILGSLLFWGMISLAVAAEQAAYVGTEVCKDCHEEQYASFMANSKKAKSFESIKKMEKKLTPGEYASCFECHTTGYGKKGGFVSERETPALKIAGCEVCHGPGEAHVETQDPDLIGRVDTTQICSRCHDENRVEAFDFKPLLFGGAH